MAHDPRQSRQFELVLEVGGREVRQPLVGTAVAVGRNPDNTLSLSDSSVSRYHTRFERRGSQWWLRDLGSTNGTRLNGESIEEASLGADDLVQVGRFEIRVAEVAVLPVVDSEEDKRRIVERIPNATVIRPLSEFAASFESFGKESKRRPRNEAFRLLSSFARQLIRAEVVPEVLEGVLSIAFEAFGIDRGFVFLDTDDERARCELARFGETVERRPTTGVPISRTLIDVVYEDRVSLLTLDAQSDDRLAAGASIRLHGIRAAMIAPLWSGDTIIGLVQVDSTVESGAFDEQDLDFLTALANYAAVAVERLRAGERAEHERKLRSRFERYHSPAVIEELVDEAGEGPRALRPAVATVLFADASGFTAFSEKATPEEVAEVLRGYFDQAVEAIFAYGGTLDKFIGDAVMAFFGAPRPQADHAVRAVEAALLARSSLAAWNDRRRSAGETPMEVKFAINSGPVVVGDIGSRRRVDYTVLGNTVNVAARIESYLSKAGDIIIGPETHRLLVEAGSDLSMEDLGEFQMKGLEVPIRAWKVLDRDDFGPASAPTIRVGDADLDTAVDAATDSAEGAGEVSRSGSSRPSPPEN